MAKRDGVSLSLKVRDLIKEAIFSITLTKKLESLKGEAGIIYKTPSEAKAHLHKLIKK